MIKLTTESLRAIVPRAPQAVIDAFVAKQDLLTNAGINATRARMTYFFANIEHECGGFTIPNLTENTRYTAGRMAQVWPRHHAAVFGSQPFRPVLALHFADVGRPPVGLHPEQLLEVDRLALGFQFRGARFGRFHQGVL